MKIYDEVLKRLDDLTDRDTSKIDWRKIVQINSVKEDDDPLACLYRLIPTVIIVEYLTVEAGLSKLSSLLRRHNVSGFQAHWIIGQLLPLLEREGSQQITT